MMEVEHEGGELSVARECGVNQFHTVSEHGHTTDHQLVTVDGQQYLDGAFDAVTKDLAQWLWDEFDIRVEDEGLDVIDPSASDVQRL